MVDVKYFLFFFEKFVKRKIDLYKFCLFKWKMIIVKFPTIEFFVVVVVVLTNRKEKKKKQN